jgi:hypothetical protein
VVYRYQAIEVELDDERGRNRNARRGLREQNVFENVFPGEVPALRLAGSRGNDGYCRLGVIHPILDRAAFGTVMVDVQHINATTADQRERAPRGNRPD